MEQKFVMIATWAMAFESLVVEYKKQTQGSKAINDALIDAVSEIEDYPYYRSVGYGSLPNCNGRVSLEAAFMDGDSLKIGAVAAIENYANPIKIAYKLKDNQFNSFLVGSGAEEYALANKFERKNMVTSRSLQLYEKRLKEIANTRLKPYSGHDTVCMLGMDKKGKISVATSTSGLFMKKEGRIGDAPLSGSGFYANSSYGACAATGLGEDIMKTCISYHTVQLLKEGYDAQSAANVALESATYELKTRYGRHGDISIICCDKDGNYGSATTLDEFSFVVFNNELQPSVMLVTNEGEHYPASIDWIENYFASIHTQTTF